MDQMFGAIRERAKESILNTERGLRCVAVMEKTSGSSIAFIFGKELPFGWPQGAR